MKTMRIVLALLTLLVATLLLAQVAPTFDRYTYNVVTINGHQAYVEIHDTLVRDLDTQVVTPIARERQFFTSKQAKLDELNATKTELQLMIASINNRITNVTALPTITP